MTPVAPVSATSSLPVSTPPSPPPKSGGTGGGYNDSETQDTGSTTQKDSSKTSGVNVLV